MKKLLPIVALVVVALANVWTWAGTIANRASPRGGTLLLTEHELGFPEESEEGAFLRLEIEWATDNVEPRYQGAATWLDAEKLIGLGLDPQLPALVAADPDHVLSALTLPVYVVLELREQNRNRVLPNDVESESPYESNRTRLFVIDAGRDPAALRTRYGDHNRYAITRGLVGTYVERAEDRDVASPPPPRLRGRLDTILPSHVFIPRPHYAVLAEAYASHAEKHRGSNTRPPFIAKVCWGTRYEPWLDDLGSR